MADGALGWSRGTGGLPGSGTDWLRDPSQPPAPRPLLVPLVSPPAGSRWKPTDEDRQAGLPGFAWVLLPEGLGWGVCVTCTGPRVALWPGHAPESLSHLTCPPGLCATPACPSHPCSLARTSPLLSTYEAGPAVTPTLQGNSLRLPSLNLPQSCILSVGRIGSQVVPTPVLCSP